MRARSLRAWFRLPFVAIGALLVLALGGCAGIPGREPVRLQVVDLEPLHGEGLEARFNVRLRLQNPNDTEIEYDGIALELELNGKPFATGVSDQKGRVPRFGEAVIGVPVSVSALAAMRQALRLFKDAQVDNVPYLLRARLGGSMFGGASFTETGTLSLPDLGIAGD